MIESDREDTLVCHLEVCERGAYADMCQIIHKVHIELLLKIRGKILRMKTKVMCCLTDRQFFSVVFPDIFQNVPVAVSSPHRVWRSLVPGPERFCKSRKKIRNG